MTARRNTTPTDDPTVTPTDDETTPTDETDSAPSFSVGDVVKIGDGYALVVGSEEVDHRSERGDTTTEDHPLVVDLPAPRRVETGYERV